MGALGWLERLLNTVADHGMELVGLKERGAHRPSDSELCHRLVDGMGEASNIALAREILQRWQEMDRARRIELLQVMAVELDPDPLEIRQAAQQYSLKDPQSLRRLLEACEPPRQELFRRLNMAPGATGVLVDMRAFLLDLLPEQPRLRGVDYDMHHLLTSWFNRGFLRLERIDWDSPASILEKLIRYEAVHPMQGWDDLRRRLAADRRCFAFFHPALPQDPLIFVEVALTRGSSDAILPLIDPHSPPTDLAQVDTAIFYSINNALQGLRGISFGNFLIKQVVSELKAEFPGMEQFLTLSPLPRLRSSLRRLFEHQIGERSRADLLAVLGERAEPLCRLAACDDPLQALDRLAEEGDPGKSTQNPLLLEALRDLALFYLAFLKRGDHALEPVAHFHLSNGAQLDRINLFANPLPRGLHDAWGCMVNFRYTESDLVANHEAYLCEGRIVLSSQLQQRQAQLQALLDRD